MTGIGTLGGHTSNGYDINDLGKIVGDSSLANGEMHAFVWDSATGMHDLGPAGTQSIATHINNDGLIVGIVEVDQDGNQYRRPAVFDIESGYSFLQDLIPANSGWTLGSATDINDLGQIVGVGNFNGHVIPYLLTPIPEPHSSLLLAISAFIFAGRMRAGRS